MDYKNLVKEALAAREMAYIPYSGFAVGAALVTKEGKIYRGCNIENAAFSPTNCAERTAFFKAVSEGERDFSKIADVGGKDLHFKDYFAPCGVCRQVMREFCEDDFIILLGKDGEDFMSVTLSELLPLSFSKSNIDK